MTIVLGDCLDVMQGMDSNSISAIVTDPPYGIGFMGKKWDASLPAVDIWKEALRVAKPGAFLLAFGGTRTYHRLACAIEDAGWEIRDCLQWIYGSGFPKSHNHFGIDGYGTALKPAHEPILMAMKPCDGTFKENAEKWGQAGINIDECRIETGDSWKRDCTGQNMVVNVLCNRKGIQKFSNDKGRWPANIILDEEAGKLVDEQSGFSVSRPNGKSEPDIKKGGDCFRGGWKDRVPNLVNDSGGASRFFYCAKASSSERNEGLEGIAPIKCGTGALRDSNRGKVASNSHPTVKPLKLMEYLIKLVMPPKDGLLLDPFAGSGTTILAAYRLGEKAIGIEKSEEYCQIARARIAACAVGESANCEQQLELSIITNDACVPALLRQCEAQN